MNPASIGRRALLLGMTALMPMASVAASRRAAVEVVVKGLNTNGTRPDGSTVLIDIKVDAA